MPEWQWRAECATQTLSARAVLGGASYSLDNSLSSGRLRFCSSAEPMATPMLSPMATPIATLSRATPRPAPIATPMAIPVLSILPGRGLFFLSFDSEFIFLLSGEYSFPLSCTANTRDWPYLALNGHAWGTVRRSPRKVAGSKSPQRTSPARPPALGVHLVSPSPPRPSVTPRPTSGDRTRPAGARSGSPP